MGLRAVRDRIRTAAPMLRRITTVSSGRATWAGTNALALLLTARWAGPAEFGALAVVITVLMMAAGVLELGLPTFSTRAAALGRHEAVGHAMFLNLAGSAVFVAGALLAANWFPVGATAAFMLLTASVAFEKNASLRMALGSALGSARVVGNVLHLRAAMSIAGTWAGHLGGIDPVLAYAAARCLATAVSAVVLGVTVRGWPLRARRPRDGSMESLGAFAGAGVFTSVSQLDTSIVAAMVGAAGAGVYSAAMKLMTPFSLVAQATGPVLMAVAVRRQTAGVRAAVQVLTVVVPAALAAAALLVVVAPSLTGLVFGPQYAPEWRTFAAALAGIPAAALLPIVATLLNANGRARLCTVLTSATTTIVLVALFPVAALGGSFAAAALVTGALWVRFGAMWAVLVRMGAAREDAGSDAPRRAAAGYPVDRDV